MTLAFFFILLSTLFAGMMAFGGFFSKQRSATHWLFAMGMIAFAIENLCTALTLDTSRLEEIIFWQDWRLVARSFLPGLWFLFSCSYARGDFAEILKKRKFLLGFGVVLSVAISLIFRPELLIPIHSTDSGSVEKLALGATGFVVIIISLIGFILILMNLERTYRAAVGTMRWRIKFMILGLGVLFAVRIYTSSQNLLFRSIDLHLQTLDSAALLISCVLIVRSFARAGHFEVNVYPSQFVLHNSFTVILAGIYLLLVGVLAKVVAFFGGDSTFGLKAFLVLVCLVALAMFLLSDRVRLSFKRYISRNFQRPMHDYRTVWRTFTDGTARCVEQSDLCNASAKILSETFQALSVTIWLTDQNKERFTFAASTSVAPEKAKLLSLESADARPVIVALAKETSPVDIDSSKADWSVALRMMHPDEFHKGGNRVCVPMVAGGELLGIIMLGDRVGGAPFLLQDLDLLKSVGDQAAAGLLNIQMSQRLSQAKQLEAFQAMSTFFVHDLKNTATMLSLMLKNLPVHFNDPSFREDALRGVSKTVAHINDLIGRLGVLRQGLSVKLVESDLNALVEEILKDLPKPSFIELRMELRPLPRVFLDAFQIRNVVTNLVLNAQEAVGQHGQIAVETSQNNGWIKFSVIDNGCGISEEFMRNSLFRPFQTTKKKGIGIGMFQCKMIAEAHRGRIEVESQLSKGTAFHVLLPTAK